ncbi:MAG: S8 family serine peptidase [Micromonosporaceae bacterium]
MRRTAGIMAVGGLLSVLALAAAPGAYADRPAAPGVPQKPAPRCEGEKPPGGPDIPHEPPEQGMLAMKKAWAISTGKGVTVAVLDSGVDVTNPQLRHVASGADFKTSGNGRYDCFGHGTAIASLIGAKPKQGSGFRGLAYDAKILPVVVSGEHDLKEDLADVTSAAKFAQAIDWAVNHGAKVINISVTVPDNPAIKRAIAKAVSADVVVVATVGNQAVPTKKEKDVTTVGSSPPTSYPASYDGVIGVSAVAQAKDGHWPPLQTSQWGDYVDLAAPGGPMVVCDRTKGQTVTAGTSPAAAFVSAAAALVRAKWPDMSAEEVTHRLYATASPAAGSRAHTGHGIVNPYRALTEELSGESPVAPVGGSPASPAKADIERDERWEFNGTLALVAGVGGVALAAGMLSTLTLLPLGIRRRWRPGRTKVFPEPPQDDTPPAPRKLFEDLEPK